MTEQNSAPDMSASPTKVYQLATEPVFRTDFSLPSQDISWEVSDGTPHILPFEETPPDSEEGETLEETPPEEEIENQEEAAPPEEEEAPEEKIKKKNRISEKKRIAELTRKYREAQAVANDVMNRNQDLEKKLAQKEKEAFTNEENFLKAQKERVKQFLTDAIEEGDAKQIAEAQDLLSQYNAQIQLKQNQVPPKAPAPYTPPSPIVNEVDSELNEEGEAWLENNSWANPNSEDFDQDLYNYADKYSIQLANKYKLQGKKSEIGSPKFWNDISHYMNKTFEINAEDSDEEEPASPPKIQPKGRTPMKSTPSQTASPVSRQSVPGGAPKKANDIVLTHEQKEMAHLMRGYVKDPKTGQKIMDNKTLEEIYKRNMR
jgi:hypothetical protein